MLSPSTSPKAKSSGAPPSGSGSTPEPDEPSIASAPGRPKIEFVGAIAVEIDHVERDHGNAARQSAHRGERERRHGHVEVRLDVQRVGAGEVGVALVGQATGRRERGVDRVLRAGQHQRVAVVAHDVAGSQAARHVVADVERAVLDVQA